MEDPRSLYSPPDRGAQPSDRQLPLIRPSAVTSIPPDSTLSTGAQHDPTPAADPQRLLPKLKFFPDRGPRHLTGAAALADARRHEQLMEQQRSRQTSPNPAAVALNALRGNLSTSSALNGSDYRATEPSLSGAAPAPVRLDVDPQREISQSHVGALEPSLNTSQRPREGVALTPSSSGRPSIDDNLSSLPSPADIQAKDMTSDVESQRPLQRAGKRHKCPYCSTDFTRHHNLKSHLLTHSQEKPYTCESCPAQFRRLHDLKRHTKLHSGERPHLCPSCGRRFARGDALARHTRGPLGCAGRRSEFGGSVVGDEDTAEIDPDDSMDGVKLLRPGDVDPDDGLLIERPSRDEDTYRHSRRSSEPHDRKRARYDDTPDSPRQPVFGTYPPYPRAAQQPSQALPTPGAAPELPRMASLSYPAPNRSNAPPIFGRGAITTSPGPLSPALVDGGAQQQPSPAFRSSISEATGPERPSYPHHHHLPRAGPPTAQAPTGPQLPSINDLDAPSQLQHVQQSPLYMSHRHQSLPHPLQHQISGVPPDGPANTSGMPANHSQQAQIGRPREVSAHDMGELWAFIRSLEQRFTHMQDEYELRISRLQEDVIALRQRMVQR